jgi:thymidylate synthase
MLKHDPQNRRMIVSLWNIEDLPDMALQPCAYQTLWDVTDGRLNCMLIQRSGDMGLGVPFNMTQYAVLIHLIAQSVGLQPGLFTHVINNAHIYENHIAAMKTQLSRREQAMPAPRLLINPDIHDFYQFTPDDIRLDNYQHLGKLSMEVAV